MDPDPEGALHPAAGRGAELRVRLGGDLDAAAVARLQAVVRRTATEDTPTVVLDLRGCTDVDAAGAEGLLAMARERAARGGRLLLRHPQPRLLLLLALAAGPGGSPLPAL